jgi:hypothetical protein
VLQQTKVNPNLDLFLLNVEFRVWERAKCKTSFLASLPLYPCSSQESITYVSIHDQLTVVTKIKTNANIHSNSFFEKVHFLNIEKLFLSNIFNFKNELIKKIILIGQLLKHVRPEIAIFFQVWRRWYKWKMGWLLSSWNELVPQSSDLENWDE